MLFHEKLPHRFSQIIFHHADHAGRFGEIVRHLGVALCDALNPVNLAHDAFRLAQLLQGGTVNMLRDLLEQMFPKSDVRMLLKELLDKGYIYWNGHEVLYSHEMFLN